MTASQTNEDRQPVNERPKKRVGAAGQSFFMPHWEQQFKDYTSLLGTPRSSEWYTERLRLFKSRHEDKAPSAILQSVVSLAVVFYIECRFVWNHHNYKLRSRTWSPAFLSPLLSLLRVYYNYSPHFF